MGESVAFCCENGCTTKAQMRAQHGSPRAFSEAAWSAIDMLTPREIRSAIAQYEKLYDDAPDGDDPP
jgi:hypothetical protein